MKKLLLTALLCFCVSAYAADWEKYHENERAFFYIDKSDIKKNKGFTYYTDLQSNFEPDGRMYSVITKNKTNCRDGTVMLKATGYSQPMGKGKVLFEQYRTQFMKPGFDQLHDDATEFVCKKWFEFWK